MAAPADIAADAAVADAGGTTIVLDPGADPDPEADPAPEADPTASDPQEPTAGPVSKLAVVALVTGVLALVPIAVVCGIAALIGIRRSGRRGHGMATAALFASAAWVIIGSAVGTVAVLTHGFQKPVTIKYRESAVFKLREGDCVNMPNGQVVSVLPCSTPHEAEVFATFSLPASAWPGTAAVKQEASSGCVSRLTGYLNPQLAISLAQSYVFPDKAAWTAGTRTVICEVQTTNGQPLTGAVRGASLYLDQQPPGGPGMPGPSVGSSTSPYPPSRSTAPKWITYQFPRQEIREAIPNERS
jgi:Septum formation